MRDSAIGEALHASDYAEYAYLQLAQDSAAKALVERLPSLVARFDPSAIIGRGTSVGRCVRHRGDSGPYALERRDWRGRC